MSLFLKIHWKDTKLQKLWLVQADKASVRENQICGFISKEIISTFTLRSNCQFCDELFQPGLHQPRETLGRDRGMCKQQEDNNGNKNANDHFGVTQKRPLLHFQQGVPKSEGHCVLWGRNLSPAMWNKLEGFVWSKNPQFPPDHRKTLRSNLDKTPATISFERSALRLPGRCLRLDNEARKNKPFCWR